MAMVKGGGAIPGLGAPGGIDTNITETKVQFICTEDQKVSAFLLTSLGILGITANIISPGPIEGERNDPTMAAHIAGMANRVPVGRLGTGDEVAAACALLASDKGGFINGQMIQVNGGAET